MKINLFELLVFHFDCPSLDPKVSTSEQSFLCEDVIWVS